MLEVGAVIDAGSQYTNGRRLDVIRSQVLQDLQQVRWIIVHRTHPGRLEYLGKCAFEHLAILQHIRDARGAAQVVFEHIKAPVVVPHQVGAGHMAPDSPGRG